MQATTAIILDKRRPLKDGSFPVKLRITYNRKYRRYKTDLSLLEKEFDKVMGKSPRGIFKDYRLMLNKIEEQAVYIIDHLESFSFDAFEKKFINKDRNTLDIFEIFKIKMDELQSEQRLGTLETYQCSLNSLKEFHASSSLLINEVSIKFLHDYEKWMISRGRSLTTVGIYLRNLRAIFNLAIEENQISDVISPFGKKKYQIPAPKNVKKALSIDEIKRLYQYKTEPGSLEQKYRDLWFFSYLCNGMNMKDICLLQHKNIQDNHIYFYRRKTINSVRDSEPIDVTLIAEAQAILQRWGTSENSPEDFVFPFVTHDMNPQKVDATIKQVTKMTNKYIRRIAGKVGIDKPISTYWARHSFATILMRANVGTEFISKQLGHTSLKTTANYLGSFEDDAKREITKKLLDF